MGVLLKSFREKTQDQHIPTMRSLRVCFFAIFLQFAPSIAKADACCKICKKGVACGNSCISEGLSCHKPKGCACNGSKLNFDKAFQAAEDQHPQKTSRDWLRIFRTIAKTGLMTNEFVDMFQTR